HNPDVSDRPARTRSGNLEVNRHIQVYRVIVCIIAGCPESEVVDRVGVPNSGEVKLPVGSLGWCDIGMPPSTSGAAWARNYLVAASQQANLLSEFNLAAPPGSPHSLVRMRKR